MHFTEAQLLSVKELNDAVKNGSDQEALFMKKQVGDDVKRVTDSYKKLETEPIELPIVKFAPVKKYKEVFPQFGQLFEVIAIPGNVRSLVFLHNHLWLVAYLTLPPSLRIVTMNAVPREVALLLYRHSQAGEEMLFQ